MLIAPVQEKLITGDKFYEMGDIGPSELVKGNIVPMSTTGGEHGLLEAEITRHLGNFNAQRKVGWVLGGEAGVYTHRNPDTVRGMDAAFISKERHPARPKGYLEVAPELVVEIISPNDRWAKIQEKLAEYFEIGVDQVWLVEPKERVIYVYTDITTLTRFSEDDVLRGTGALAEFELPLALFFAD